MDLGLNGHVYIVTGASGGLGFASAQQLVADGARVVIASRDEERITAAAERLAAPGRVRAVAADLAETSTPTKLIDAAQTSFGRLDGGVISVGGPAAGTMQKVTEEQWRSAFDSVFMGGLRMAKALLDTDYTVEGQMAVSMVLSSSVKSPIPGLAISNGLRPGLAMAAKTLADEYGPRGGRVNVIMPGRIDTDRVKSLDAMTDDPKATKDKAEQAIPLRRYGTPEEFGRVVAFVTSPAGSYLSGAAIPVDGGMLRAL